MLEVEIVKCFGKDLYEVLMDIVVLVKLGVDGLLFYLYFLGECVLFWDVNVKGLFFGLGLYYKKEYMICVVLEGVIFNLYMVLLVFEELIGEFIKI